MEKENNKHNTPEDKLTVYINSLSLEELCNLHDLIGSRIDIIKEREPKVIKELRESGIRIKRVKKSLLDPEYKNQI
jgi:hypothetical protein